MRGFLKKDIVVHCLSDNAFHRIGYFYKFSNGVEDQYQFVHGSSEPLLDRHTGYITLFVPAKEWLSIVHYGPYLNFVNPKNIVKIQEVSDSIMSAISSSYENGTLPIHLEQWIDDNFGGLTDDCIAVLREDLNPDNIVNSALLWDDPDFVSWVWQEVFDGSGIDFIEVESGAIAFGVDSADMDIKTVHLDEMD